MPLFPFPFLFSMLTGDPFEQGRVSFLPLSLRAWAIGDVLRAEGAICFFLHESGTLSYRGDFLRPVDPSFFFYEANFTPFPK